LATYEGQTASIVDWLTIGRVDMGLVYSPPLSPTYRLKKIEDIELSLISKVGRHKPKSLRDTVSLHDVMKQPLVMLTKDHAVRRLLEQQARGTRLNVVYEVEDVSGVAATLDLVESGVGSTILPFHATFINGRNSRPGLISQKIVSPALTLPLYLALPNHRPITPLSKRVAKYLETFVPQTMSSLRQQCW
jgi:LysR family nitrogen assimilation transcriptional regulator